MELRLLIDEGKITYGTLSTVLQISIDELVNYIENTVTSNAIPLEAERYLTELAMLLGVGFTIEDDDRLCAIIESLLHDYKMDVHALALLFSVDEHMIEAVRKGNEVEITQKYKLAIRASFLYYIFKFPKYKD